MASAALRQAIEDILNNPFAAAQDGRSATQHDIEKAFRVYLGLCAEDQAAAASTLTINGHELCNAGIKTCHLYPMEY